ncbi:MAG: radical SAM protein [bacterium]
MPLAIGCIKSYLLAFSRFAPEVEVRLFKDPQRAIDAFLEERPGMVGFSNYSWNFDLGTKIAREMKRLEPECLVVFGGPNYPLEDERCEAWFRKVEAADLYIIGDGEETFTKVFDFWYEYGDIEALKRRGFDGCHAMVDGRFFKANDAIPRMKQLDLAPSPYLQGYFDEWLGEESFIPMMETTRGCPFTCTFCEKGSLIWSKIHRKSVERFEAELEYVAQRYPGKLVALADDNFGMYEQDQDFARAIARVKEKYDYPYFVNTSTGKNKHQNILKVSEILRGSLQFMASVQSMDDEVLRNIKRKNISYEVMIQSAKQALSYDSTTRSEVIIGLPGDTLRKHQATVYKLIDADIRILHIYTLILLEGTELATTVERERWGMETKYRVNSGCFGAYSFAGRDLLSAEIEEVCVASRTMPFEDYIECRMLTFTVGVFYSDLFLNEIYRFLENFGIKPSQVIDRLFRNRKKFSPGLLDLFAQFEAATRSELWDSESALWRHLGATREGFEQYIQGGEGRNLLFNFRGMALKSYMEEVIEQAFEAVSDVLKAHDESVFREYEDYLAELKRFSLCRKVNVFDYSRRCRDVFHYDFMSLNESNFEGLPERLPQPVELEFFSTQQQVRMMTIHGTDLLGIRKIFSRWDIGRLQRSIRQVGRVRSGQPDAGEPRHVERIVREPYQSH